jgi:PAS domain S-box-containing protein
VDHAEKAQPLPAAGWDSATVAEAATPRIAADELNRIVAVSPSAVELLGYDDASQLLDQRIVSIIPERFRQAHIAGFTLYLLVARAPLVGKPVAVQALRADGTEVDVELLVTSERTGDGREVFMADLRPV